MNSQPEHTKEAQELARARAELEQYSHAISHDLQEPVRKIINFAQLLEKTMPEKLEGDAKRYLTVVIDGAMRMRDMIRDLVQFSQLGRGEPTPERVDTNDVVKKVLFEIQPLVKESAAQIHVSSLPVVNAEPELLYQVFLNLLSNALKFRGPEAPRIDISATKEKDRVVFSVKDNGLGIDEQYSDRIFKLFQRLHTREAYPGSGVGLAVCKKIVERMGGEIWMTSKPNQGATFLFTIPSANN